MHGMNAARAYNTRSADRSLKLQEADIFLRATAAMRIALHGGALELTKAVSDNRLLWMSVVSALKDPSNALPNDLKASIIAVGMAVQRELAAVKPDLPFLIGINEHIIAGLNGR